MLKDFRRNNFFYQDRAPEQKAANESLDSYKQPSPMKDEVFNAIKLVYENLSKKNELLEQCVRGYTQNSNVLIQQFVNRSKKHFKRQESPRSQR